MLPLFGDDLRIDVCVSSHQRRHERIWYSADSEGDIFEAFVTEIGLADEHAVIVLGERSGAAVAAERDVGRISFVARFEPNPEEPIIGQSSAQADAQPVTLAFALLPIIFLRNVIRPAAATIFVADTDIAVELELSDRAGKFPFSAGSGGRFLGQLGPDFFRFLISD